MACFIPEAACRDSSYRLFVARNILNTHSTVYACRPRLRFARFVGAFT